MLKKSMIALFLSIVFALTLGTSGAFAEEVTMSEEVAKAIEEIEKTNVKIYEEIDSAVKKSEDLYAQKLVDLSKEQGVLKRAQIIAKYEEEISKLIYDLDMKTQQMSQDEVAKAAEKAGLKVEIYWVNVQFADREALIDPLRAVGW